MKKPVTILTGFLGSGKTTLLNNLLHADHGLRLALMINDFGDVNIDKDLVVDSDESMIELSGGCMCCTVREDLLTSAQELLNSGKEFDNLIIETSGLADPGSVAQTFLTPGMEEHFRLDAVITVVDGANVETWIEENEIAVNQIGCADLLIVNKLDLMEPDDMDRVKIKVREINAAAETIGAINCDVPSELLLDIEMHISDRPLPTVHNENHYHEAGGGEHCDTDHDHDHDHGHHHNDGVVTATIDLPIELEYGMLDEFVRTLPDNIYRAKGILAVRGFNRRVIFHRVGHRNVLDQGEYWGDEEKGVKAMFLGRDFDSDLLINQLRNCAQPG